jgi:type I restriction enzyme S subunit
MVSKWRQLCWGDIATLEYGKALSDYKGAPGKYPVFGTNGPIGWNDKPLYPYPSVIIGRKGAYRGVHFSSNPFWVIDTAFYLKPKIDLDIKWAYYQLLTQDINSLDSGSAIPSTTRESFYHLPVLLPPIEDQRAIATILGTLDDKIELNWKMNETLEAMAQAIFKSWFVDFDPIRAKAEGRKPSGMDAATADLFPDSFQDSPLGKILKGWKMCTLYDCAGYINGLAFRNEDFSPERLGLPVIKIGELKDGITRQTKFTEVNLEQKYLIRSGDILFSWSGSPDTSIDIFVWTGENGWLNQHIFKIQIKRPLEKIFVYFLLRHFKSVFIEIARNKQTTGLGHVTAQDLKRLKTVFPPDEVLRVFNHTVEPFFEKAYTNRCETRTLAVTRDSLLSKLLSGEIRVKDAERFLEALTEKV